MHCTIGRGTFVGGAALALAAAAVPRCATSESGAVLVVVSQTGGCDLLNTVVPLAQYGRYHDLRRPVKAPDDPALTLAIPLERLRATALDGSLALHPNLARLHRRFRAGNAAVIVGIGLPKDEPARLSHEAARFDWQTGTIGKFGYGRAGWVGRGLRARGRDGLPATASLGGDVPVLLQGGSEGALALTAPLENFTSDIPGDDDAQRERLRKLADDVKAGTIGDRDLLAAETSLDARRARVARIAERNPARGYPEQKSGIGEQLRQVARLIEGGAGIRVYFADHDGYDTHAAQQSAHPALLAELDAAIDDFFTYLRARDRSRNVVLLTMTDFGRRAQGDANFGTDHGTAAAAFAIGDRVRGGLYGEYPDLRRLDDDENVAVPVDVRRVVADAARLLDIDPRDAAGGAAPLGFLT